jgi:hypothetical protein
MSEKDCEMVSPYESSGAWSFIMSNSNRQIERKDKE